MQKMISPPRTAARQGAQEIGRRILRRWGTLFFTLLLVAILGSISPHFLTAKNLMNVVRQSAIVTVIGLGLTVVLSAGSFDISIGSIAGFCNVLSAYLMQQGFSFWVAASVGIVAGTVLGAVNGFLVAKMRINPFLATVSMMFFASGLDILFSGGVRVMVPSRLLEICRRIGVGSIGPFPVLALVLIGIAGLCYVLLGLTLYGRRIYAVGASPRCASLSGISIERYRWLCHTLCGTLCALGGILMTARLSSGVPLAGLTLLGDAINAAFIGMTFLCPGKPNVPGTILGGLLLAILANGFMILNVPFYYQYMVWALIVVIAVSFSGSKITEVVVIGKVRALHARTSFLKFLGNYGTLLLMAAIIVLLSVVRPAFLQLSNLMDILRYATPTAIMSIGLTFVIAGGGFDISIGSMASLATVLTAALIKANYPVPAAITSVLLTGLLLGWGNGLMCARLGLNPFVATLATLLFCAGPQYMMSGGGLPITIESPPFLSALGKGYIGPVPILVIVLICVTAICHIFYTRTRTGIYISAIGGSPQAALTSGVQVERIVTITYLLSGFLAALAGVLLTARLSAGLTKVAEPYLTDAIAAVFLGSTFLSRGQPHVVGTVAGAVFMGVITNGLTLLGVPFWGDYMFRGLMVLAAVALSGLQSR